MEVKCFQEYWRHDEFYLLGVLSQTTTYEKNRAKVVHKNES